LQWCLASADRQPSGRQNVDVQSVEHLIALYATSIDQVDTALASQIWSHFPEVSFIDPAGHEHGFDEVVEKFYRHTMGGGDLAQPCD